MADHVLANRRERTDLLKLDVKGFDLFGDASRFSRNGGTVSSAIGGRESPHRAECSTRVKLRGLALLPTLGNNAVGVPERWVAFEENLPVDLFVAGAVRDSAETLTGLERTYLAIIWRHHHRLGCWSIVHGVRFRLPQEASPNKSTRVPAKVLQTCAGEATRRFSWAFPEELEAP